MAFPLSNSNRLLLNNCYWWKLVSKKVNEVPVIKKSEMNFRKDKFCQTNKQKQLQTSD